MSDFDARFRMLSRNSVNSHILDRIEAPLVKPNGQPRDPYMEAGAHPEIVERLWDNLNLALPEDCRFIAISRPVLANPTTGRVFAMAYGTQYAIWLPTPEYAEAKVGGFSPHMTWFKEHVTDLDTEYGEGWLFGRFQAPEAVWLLRSYAETSST